MSNQDLPYFDPAVERCSRVSRRQRLALEPLERPKQSLIQLPRSSNQARPVRRHLQSHC